MLKMKTNSSAAILGTITNYNTIDIVKITGMIVDATSSISIVALEAAIAQLPEAYRKIILLRYYGGHSCNQIAERFNMPLGTVTKTLSRAYAMLRKLLQQQEQADVYEV